MSNLQSEYTGLEIAVIGMACRFPGAKNIEDFWNNLVNGKESITFFTDKELKEAGVDPSLVENKHYVKARPVLADALSFDNYFFDYTPREAEMMDPQHRVFLECAWEAFENAGYNPFEYDGLAGVFAGAGMNSYFHRILLNHQMNNENFHQYFIANEKDFLPTKVSYKFNLKGPSINIQTACSTGLSAIHLASRSLIGGECDCAIAGSISNAGKQTEGYLYIEGEVLSPDGHCRVFDENAGGIVFGNGVGVVVLKRLEDALEDNDTIYAVILGSAMNNDGNVKMGYATPGIEGQYQVICMAHNMSNIHPSRIEYVEANGYGTPHGDAIEIQALTKAFRQKTEKQQFCAIGSVKSNFGHLDTAAGIAGFIKTVLALHHKKIPPTLNFKRSNPQVAFPDTPFYVNTIGKDWETEQEKRIAGVSSFGIGGTNVHIILEEAPEYTCSPVVKKEELFILSAGTEKALKKRIHDFHTYMHNNQTGVLTDIAYTLQVGRQHMQYRYWFCADSPGTVLDILKRGDQTRGDVYGRILPDAAPIFLLPGVGSQCVNMGKEFYVNEPVFTNQIDNCLALFQEYFTCDLKKVLYPVQEESLSLKTIDRIDIALALIFSVEYAMVTLLKSWGITPCLLYGGLLSDYTIGCLAGVFSLRDTVTITVAYGELCKKYFEKNSVPDIVHGMTKRKNLVNAEQIIMEFRKVFTHVQLSPPEIPFPAGPKGIMITEEEALNSSYWTDRIEHYHELLEGGQIQNQNPSKIYIQAGPGTFPGVFTDSSNQQTFFKVPWPENNDTGYHGEKLQFLGNLWRYGININFHHLYKKTKPKRIPLPVYPFKKEIFRISEKRSGEMEYKDIQPDQEQPVSEWMYTPVWKQSRSFEQDSTEKLNRRCFHWLIIYSDHQHHICDEIRKGLKVYNQNIILVKAGDKFIRKSSNNFEINICSKEDYSRLISVLKADKCVPDYIVHLLSIWEESVNGESCRLEEILYASFYSLLFLLQAFSSHHIDTIIHINVLSDNLHSVIGNENTIPERAVLLGLCKTIPQEYPTIYCHAIDLSAGFDGESGNITINQLIHEICLNSREQVIAYRGNHRWVQTYERLSPPSSEDYSFTIREKGVYLVTGGLGGIGFVLLSYLADNFDAALIITGRTRLPERKDWEKYCKDHDEHNGIVKKIHKLKNLEDKGMDFYYIPGDIADFTLMKEKICEAEEKLGKIQGVFHVAGFGDASMIHDKTIDSIEKEFHPKIKGTRNINKILKDNNLDFFILFSSLVSISGATGLVGYCSANCFLDAFAFYNTMHNNCYTLSINWDKWEEVGMAVNEKRSETPALYNEFYLLKEGILVTEAPDVFHILFRNHGLNQLLVSKHSLDEYLRMRDDLLQHNIAIEKETGEKTKPQRYPRPDIRTAYVPPGNEKEQMLTEILEDLLGIDKIGVHDNFFDLGCNSLIAIQFILKAKLKGFDFSQGMIFEKQTIGELASVCIRSDE